MEETNTFIQEDFTHARFQWWPPKQVHVKSLEPANIALFGENNILR